MTRPVPARARRRRALAAGVTAALCTAVLAGCSMAPIMDGFLYDRHERVPHPTSTIAPTANPTADPSEPASPSPDPAEDPGATSPEETAPAPATADDPSTP